MDEAADKAVTLSIVARASDARIPGRRAPDHGFFNACNSALPELPLRSWGRREVAQRQAAGAEAGRDR